MGEAKLFSGGCYDGAALQRPCERDVARGDRGGVGSLALPESDAG